MSKTSARYKRRKKAIELINNISESPSDYLIIHYSCESFFDLLDGKTPRITSIAVRDIRNAQTKSFSIHKVAELKKISSSDIKKNYDELEKAMLDDYYSFVSDHLTYKWIHLNMRNIDFGFEAINHRFKVLGGNPIIINDNAKIDLARTLVDLYGNDYSPNPRFENLCIMNHITMTGFMKGEQEANAFRTGDYVLLHRSTLKKVDNMNNVITLVYENDLETKNCILKIYGITPSGVFYSAKDNWLISVCMFILGIVVTTLIVKGLNLLFNI